MVSPICSGNKRKYASEHGVGRGVHGNIGDGSHLVSTNKSIHLWYGLALCLIVFTGTRLPAVYHDFQHERISGGYMNSLY